MFDFPPAAQQDTFFEVQDFKGRVLIFVFPWGCGQDLENRIGWRSDQNVHETASHLCDFHPWFPSHEAWISLISFSEHLEFWKVTKITLHSEKVWFILQPHVKHCYFFFFFWASSMRKEPDKELISGVCNDPVGFGNQWASSIFPRVYLSWIKPVKICFQVRVALPYHSLSAWCNVLLHFPSILEQLA